MASLEIINTALSRCEIEPLDSLEDTTNAQINRVLSLYPLSRERVLQDHAWNCIATRAVLSADSEKPVFGYSYQFSLPQDCLLVVGIYGNHNYIKRERKKILSNTDSPLYLIYNSSSVDDSEFDAYLRNTISIHLSAQIAFSVKGDKKTYRDFIDQYYKEVADARFLDAREDGASEFIISEWLESRRYYNANRIFDDSSLEISNVEELYFYYGNR